jgi:hypothetical protein
MSVQKALVSVELDWDSEEELATVFSLDRTAAEVVD